MLRVGLTGGTGAGKSTAAHRMVELGAVVIDADALAREVLAPGTPGLADVIDHFGPGVRAGDGSLDRAALARLAFGSDDGRRALEAITHPRIAARTAELMAAAAPDAVVVHDVPLLVEKSMGAAYHLVVVVDAPVELRVARLQARGMASDDARARIAAQAGDEQRRAAADVLLDNGGTDLLPAVDALWHHRLVPYERNVRTASRVKRADVPTLVPYDESWPAQAARLAARVARAAGSLGRGVEHIGSTAVPGLAAKDVIDLQLGVDSMADADALAADLARAGFPVVAGNDADHVHPDIDPDADVWVKRFHGGADPGRVVNLHVRLVGGPGWRTALLMRDWWRADSSARSAYETQKRRLAASTTSTTQYAAAKEPWFAAAVPQAVAWAERPPPAPLPPRAPGVKTRMTDADPRSRGGKRGAGRRGQGGSGGQGG